MPIGDIFSCGFVAPTRGRIATKIFGVVSLWLGGMPILYNRSYSPYSFMLNDDFNCYAFYYEF
jgi:hypothetical protein